MNLRIFDSSADLVSAAARTILQRVRAGARSIALSGGSTPKPLYELLGSGPMREELAQFPITWVVVDERYVPESDAQSNSAMMKRTLFASGMSEGHRFLQFDTSVNDPAATARAFERSWRSLGLQNLDIVVLGCGDDGHTASLFPGTPIVDVTDRIAAEVFVPRLDQWRVTITKPVIRSAALRLVLATGAAKAPIIHGLRNGESYPVGDATSGEIETWWFVDRAAVG